MVLLLATNNTGKIAEIKSIFANYQVFSLKEKGIFVDVDEDADTFEGNALKKAREIYEIAKVPVIADDSGLCIDALNDWPGVFTHRFLGEDATDEERNNAIIEKMISYYGDKRAAKVMCSMAYYDGTNTIVGEGILRGKISTSRRGDNGFGFDEIFETESGMTLAEMTSEEKNKISARYLALMDLKNKLDNL